MISAWIIRFRHARYAVPSIGAVCEDETDAMRYINITKNSMTVMIRSVETGSMAQVRGETVFHLMLDFATGLPATQDY